MALMEWNMEEWDFALGEDASCLKGGRKVRIPHTWNIEAGSEDFQGIGWYGWEFVPEDAWQGKRVRVLFRAVYHDASVYLNGEKIGEHRNSGYTPFTVELTGKIKFNEKNYLTVEVDNRFTKEMLPYERSFDWANDGGIIRPAKLLITGRCLIRDLKVTARPVITAFDERQDGGAAVFALQGALDAAGAECRLEWELYEGYDECLTEVAHGAEACAASGIKIDGMVLADIKYWHFDAPCLYTLKLTLKEGDIVQDADTVVFGFRDFHVHGGRFYLNGEPVRLPGTEWMPGSDPSFGMAESKEQLEKMLLCLKQSNSILTRFHWQQDDWVYDWCDRHGMLVQEEVPFWGKNPEKAGRQQWQTSTQQIKEMVAAHRNHPSIVAWGVGNELDAQCGETVRYIKDAVAYTHRLDSERLVNYVSNTIYQGYAADGTTDGDVIMVNDYIGTWNGEMDQDGEWSRIAAANPDKALIPSEFGLCEPAFDGGDARREKIFLEKMACYRKYPNIAATVYFCLNDYRTQIGEDGEGKLKKRIHGSTGLCGEPKPSYFAVQREYSPLAFETEDGELVIRCKDDLPSYTVKGYYIQMQGEKILIPDLKPGEKWKSGLQGMAGLETSRIHRPNGEQG